MSHYFNDDPNVPHDEKVLEDTFFDVPFSFLTDAGVFSRSKVDQGSRILIETVEVRDKDRILIDMGCGYGAIGLVLAKLHGNLICHLYDVNERALGLARKNISRNGIENADASVSDLFEHAVGNADIIVTNPPIRAGKDTVFRLYEGAKDRLSDDGVLWVVIRKQQGAPSSVSKLRTLFQDVDVRNRSKGYWIIRATGSL
jgi:16S rRNA (guanine1207-N2)-methyltransferase